jgi:hypothetical protein
MRASPRRAPGACAATTFRRNPSALIVDAVLRHQLVGLARKASAGNGVEAALLSSTLIRLTSSCDAGVLCRSHQPAASGSFSSVPLVNALGPVLNHPGDTVIVIGRGTLPELGSNLLSAERRLVPRTKRSVSWRP